MPQERSADRATEVAAGFGVRLRRYRELAGLSQDQLAERAGLSAKAIGALERGERRRPHPQTVDLLVRALGLGAAERAEFVATLAGRETSAFRDPIDPVAHPAGSPTSPAAHPLDVSATRPLHHNLPTPASVLIGREREVAEVLALLHRPEVRLVTLTGPGGIGKTRLALQVARECLDAFADGICFVSLAPLVDPDLVLPTIVRALDLPETPGLSVVQLLTSYLRERVVLLVLDNLEQVLGAAPQIAEVQAACPGLKVLATSRELLRLSGEYRFEVPPLPVPPTNADATLDELWQVESVRLFVERAMAVQPAFALTSDNAHAICALCQRLEGIPLALELAAARVRLFSPPQLLARLGRRLPFLTAGHRDAPTRQQTLRSAIAWSYDLLHERERALFRRLSVFVGGFDLASAEAVCRDTEELGVDLVDGIDSLVAKSLMRVRETSLEPAFSFLETIREYGLERLEESGEAESVREAHAAYFLRLAEEAAVYDSGSAFSLWQDRLLAVVDNLRAAQVHFVARREAGRSLRLGTALQWFWPTRGSPQEGRSWLIAALDLPASPSTALLRARALYQLGYHVGANLGDSAAAIPYLSEAVDLYRTLGDRTGVALTLALLGGVRNNLGDYAAARLLVEDALAIQRQLDDLHGLVEVLRLVVDLTVDQGEVDASEKRLAEALPLARRTEATWHVAFLSWETGRIAMLQGDTARAIAAFTEGVAWARQVPNVWTERSCSFGLAYVASVQGDLAKARQLVVEGLALWQKRKNFEPDVYGLEHAAVVAAAEGQADRAARLAGAATAWRLAMPYARHPIWLTLLRRANVPIERPADPGEAAAWDQGLDMSLDHAIAYALGPEDA
jgi:predicted ATPase/transcriptional regulator with XRE-family HTH domain